MKIKTVSVTYGRKINLGDYNSANLECTIWADVEEGESVDDCLAALREQTKASVKEQAAPLIGGNGNNTKTEQTFAEKPVAKGA